MDALISQSFPVLDSIEQARSALSHVHELRQLARQHPSYPGKRKLDVFFREIQLLRQAGASQRDIRCWLRQHRVSVSQSTIAAFFKYQDAQNKTLCNHGT